MLQQFTWQHFLVATLVLTVIWYAVVILMFYRRDFFEAFSGKKNNPVNRFKKSEPLPHRWEKGVDDISGQEVNEPVVMGKSKLPDGVSRVSLEDISFSDPGNGRVNLVGLVPDLLQEIKEVFRSIAAKDGNKKDFFDLMETVRQNYPKMASHPTISNINSFIVEHAPFHLSSDELENLWD